jgi:hypothetical protein
MASSSAAPRSIRAGFVLVDAVTGAISRILEFPLTPEALVRSLETPPPARVPIEPRELISFALTHDASEALANRDPQAAENGILPLLSALETLMYSRTDSLPLVMFVWGRHRLLPVRLVSLQIAEQHFDAKLNPIHAQVAVTLHVLKEADLPPHTKGRQLWDVHLVVLQQLAASAPNGTMTDLGIAPV